MSVTIANPIYDVVFRYLMEDTQVAKTVLATLTGFDIVDLKFRPTEYAIEKQEGRDFTVYRLDFAARIRTKSGKIALILIELQKSRYATDVMRFRRYLGEQYSKHGNSEVINEHGVERRVADPIYCIYILGHELSKGVPSIARILRNYYDVGLEKTVTCQDEFVESVTHDAMIIQVPLLTKKHRNRIEALANIFNQKFRLEGDEHVLLLDGETFPEEFKPVLLRLIKAGQEPKIRKIMDVEDEILEELEFKQRSINHLKQKNKEEKSQKEEAIRQKDEALSQKDEALSQKDEALSQKDDFIKTAVKALVSTGLSEEEARHTLGLTN